MQCHYAHSRISQLAWASILLVAAATGLSQPAPPECQLTDRDCFSMGKRVVQFTPSQRYESITLYDTQAATRVLADRLALVQVPAAIGNVVDAPALASAGVVLVALAAGVEPRQLEAIIDQVAPPGVTAVVGSADRGSPVYATGTADHVLVNQLIVKFVARTPQTAIDDALAGGTVVTPPRRATYPRYVVEYPGLSAREVAALSSRLDQRDDVEFAQPNFVAIAAEVGGAPGLQNTCPVQCPSPATPSSTGDPLLAQQWYLDNQGGSGIDINAKEAWQFTPGVPEIIIAILDDAVEITHEDLAGKIHSTWNTTTHDTDLLLEDEDYHGTAVAGLAAAATNNGKGIAGVGANVSLMPVRVWDRDAFGRPIAPHDRVSEGFLVAAETAHVLNASFTLGSFPFPDVEGAIDAAMAPPFERVVVLAAGNEGNNALGFPANMAEALKNGQPRPLIVVGATDNLDVIKSKNTLNTTGCDWGSTGGNGMSVTAPGVATITTDRSGSRGFCSDAYAFIDGTSAATPLVSGTAALLLSYEPGLSPAQVKGRLEATAIDLGDSGKDAVYGSGRIDACRALSNGACEPPEGSLFKVPLPPTSLTVLLTTITTAIIIAALVKKYRPLRRPPPRPVPPLR